jgi:hypothetical protein
MKKSSRRCFLFLFLHPTEIKQEEDEEEMEKEFRIVCERVNIWEFSLHEEILLLLEGS